MQDKGLVSIIMPSYNCGRYVEESIHSVQAQTYQNWELVFVDDCSEDDTLAKALAMKERDSRIIVFQNLHHRGVAVTRNIALQKTNGRWIAFLDSDDLWEPTKLERQIAFMTENGYHFSCHRYVKIDEESKEFGVMVSSKNPIGKYGLLTCCWPGCLTVMYDFSVVGLIQIDDIKNNTDTAMWLKVVRKANCYLLPEILAKYRLRSDSITPKTLWQRILAHYPLFRVAEKMNPVASTFWVVMNVFGNAYKKLRYVKHYEVK